MKLEEWPADGIFDDEAGSLEKRRRRPVTAWETVEGMAQTEGEEEDEEMLGELFSWLLRAIVEAAWDEDAEVARSRREVIDIAHLSEVAVWYTDGLMWRV